MAVMPVRRLLLNMAWPMMLSMLIQALYNMVDSMFVAQLSADGFVALSLVYPIQTLMISICVGVGVGYNALLARRLGEGRPEEANRVVAHGYFLYLACWVIFLVLGITMARPFMGLFAPGQPQVITYGAQYLSIVIGASVGVCMQFAGERTLQATGNTVGPMIIQGIGAVVNLILDPLLIFGIGPFPRLEVAGAAIATVLGQLVGMTVGLVMVRRNSLVRLSFRGFRPDGAIIGPILRVGIPASLVQALATVMNLGMNHPPPVHRLRRVHPGGLLQAPVLPVHAGRRPEQRPHPHRQLQLRRPAAGAHYRGHPLRPGGVHRHHGGGHRGDGRPARPPAPAL